MSSSAAAPPPVSPPTAESDRRTTRRRSWSGAISGVVTYVLVALLALIPVPYLIQTPGPVVNTLGTYKGQRLITVTGAQTYEPTGTLDLLTVAVAGGPGRQIYATQALGALFASSDTVVPTEAYYPLDTTREDVTGSNAAEMTSSQDAATAAALSALDMDYGTELEVQEVTEGGAAAGKLKAGDVLTSVNGTDLRSDKDAAQTVVSTVTDTPKGETVELTYQRGEAEHSVKLSPQATADGQKIGVMLRQHFDFPVQVTFNVKDIGGPSAGTMFALAIVDELTPGDITGGKHIAGTGAISAAGEVSEIGGARQKVAAASAAGAEYFLSPAGNCAEVVEAAAAHPIHVVRVTTIDEALAAVEDIGRGKTQNLPACPTEQ